MATDERHAAAQTERSYAVQLRVAGEEPRDLASGLEEFLAAVDFAFEWLQEEDPRRDGSERLAIVELRDGTRHEVWSYPPSDEPSAGQELVGRYGFNPVSWQPPPEPALHEAAPPAPPPVSDPVHVEPIVFEPEEPEAPPGRAATLKEQAVGWAHGAWDDKATRACLIVALASLWLSIGLADPIFLLVFLVAAAGLWRLRERCRPLAPDPDDWL